MLALLLYLLGKYTSAFYLILLIPFRFTARGIVALVFSCISAFIGLAAITWYGMAPLGNAEFQSAKKLVLESGVTPPR